MRYNLEHLAASFLFSYSMLYLARYFVIAVCLSISSPVQHNLAYYAFFYGRKILPILVFSIFLSKNFNKRLNDVASEFSASMLSICIISLGGAILLSISKVQFEFALGFQWTYFAVIEWSFGVLLLFALFHKKTKNLPLSFSASYLLAALGGLIYELPLYFAKSMRINHFHKSYPFYVATTYLIPLFLIPILREARWKPSKYFLCGLLCYVLFSVGYYLSVTVSCTIPAYGYLDYIARLVTIFFLCMIPLELNQ